MLTSVTFSRVGHPTFKICEPKSVDLPVVAHLQHGWKSGVGVLGKAMGLGDPIISNDSLVIQDPLFHQ